MAELTIKGLAHVCLGVSDVERALAFYRDKLGFRPAYDFVSDKGEKIGQCLHLGGRTFLEFFRSSQPPPAGHPHFCLEVDDIKAAVAELRRRGVQVGEIGKGSDRSWQVWLADPDGNRIELHQFTPDSLQVKALERLATA